MPSMEIKRLILITIAGIPEAPRADGILYLPLTHELLRDNAVRTDP